MQTMRMVAPMGCRSMNWQGTRIDVVDGVAEVPAAAIDAAISHGFLPMRAEVKKVDDEKVDDEKVDDEKVDDVDQDHDGERSNQELRDFILAKTGREMSSRTSRKKLLELVAEIEG